MAETHKFRRDCIFRQSTISTEKKANFLGEIQLRKSLIILSALAAALIPASSASCSGDKAEKSAVDFTSTAHTEVYDVTRYNRPQYQWFIFDKDKTVIDSGISEDTAPEISETDTKISVYFSAGDGEYMYREYYPQSGGMTDLYQCITDEKGNRICFSDKAGTFNFAEVLHKYWDTEEGVNRDFFTNLDEYVIEDEVSAFKRAANEINTSYNSADIAFDEGNNMWAVTFGTIGETGGQTVYLDGKGKTRLIISEE